MGNNSFAPFQKRNTSFIVKNIITDSNKTVRIFHYPIPVGTERDLLAIPGVSESDIRASLLKGEILHKILAGEIHIVSSDIDLLQFNTEQKVFLQNAGVTIGLEVTDAQFSGHDTLRQLIHFIDEGPGDGFDSGAYKEVIGQPFPTSTVWYVSATKVQKIVEKLITYNVNSLPSTITWNMYNIDGVTILHTVVDTITYQNNAFESTRTRTIS